MTGPAAGDRSRGRIRRVRTVRGNMVKMGMRRTEKDGTGAIKGGCGEESEGHRCIFDGLMNSGGEDAERLGAGSSISKQQHENGADDVWMQVVDQQTG
jgi:hypothetical protein